VGWLGFNGHNRTHKRLSGSPNVPLEIGHKLTHKLVESSPKYPPGHVLGSVRQTLFQPYVLSLHLRTHSLYASLCAKYVKGQFAVHILLPV